MNTSNSLQFASYLAPNLFWFYQAIGTYWERSLSIQVSITQSQYDPLDDPLLLNDQWDGAFICGLPFSRYCNRVPQQLEAIVAPVLQASRYEDEPVYFSDVIVSATSNLRTFTQLSGKTFCYNDLGSNSGYNLLRHHLLQTGYPSSFFSQSWQSSSHQQSMRWVANGTADCAAIDSMVLEQELRHHPELVQQLRVIASIGPSPMPPIVIAQRLGRQWLDRLQAALLQPDSELQAQMQQAQVRRFAPVQSVNYQKLAQMYDRAMQSGYELVN